MSHTQQAQKVESTKKPVWMIRGTCGGCKGFDIKPGDEVTKVTCKKPESPMQGARVGMMQVNMCDEYEDRTEVPVGFNLI